MLSAPLLRFPSWVAGLLLLRWGIVVWSNMLPLPTSVVSASERKSSGPTASLIGLNRTIADPEHCQNYFPPLFLDLCAALHSSEFSFDKHPTPRLGISPLPSVIMRVFSAIPFINLPSSRFSFLESFLASKIFWIDTISLVTFRLLISEAGKWRVDYAHQRLSYLLTGVTGGNHITSGCFGNFRISSSSCTSGPSLC